MTSTVENSIPDLSNLSIHDKSISGEGAGNMLGFSRRMNEELAKSREILDAFVTRTEATVERIKELNRQGVKRESSELQELLQELADVRSKIAAAQDGKQSLYMKKTGLERERGAILKDCQNSLPARLSGE